MFLHSFFKGFLVKDFFRSVALVTKKLREILDFFFYTDQIFFSRSCTLPYALKNIFPKNFIKSKKNSYLIFINIQHLLAICIF